MKPKVLNDKFSFLTEEQRALLYALSEGTSSTVNLPIILLKEKVSLFPGKGSSRVVYKDGRVKYRTLVPSLEVITYDLRDKVLPTIAWDNIVLTETQIEAKHKFVSYLESLNS